jgi:hypothetical protein
LASAPQAIAINDDARYEACPRCEPKNLVWSGGQYDQVYLVPGPGGNSGPRVLNAEPLARLLAKLTVGSGSKVKPLLGEDASGELARGLVAAMARAEPQHDVAFFITSRGNSGIFASRVGHSGTAFLNAQGLNLIFGEANVDFFSAYKASRINRPFEFGGRGHASKVVLGGEGVAHPRPDWVVIPLGAPPVAAPPPQTVGGPATTQGVGDTTTYQSVGQSVAPAAAAAPAAAPALAAPVATVAPVAPAAPAAPVVPAPAKGSDAFYQAQEVRLKNLKRLREQGLLTEEEYQGKRREILKDL